MRQENDCGTIQLVTTNYQIIYEEVYDMSFFQNTCKPEGFGGKIMVNMMNTGHSSMAEWGFEHIKIQDNDISLDIGCGGGANIKRLLEKSPHGKVTGIDYSDISVKKSEKKNKAEIKNNR